jgi:hypothetical protein
MKKALFFASILVLPLFAFALDAPTNFIPSTSLAITTRTTMGWLIGPWILTSEPATEPMKNR